MMSRIFSYLLVAVTVTMTAPAYAMGAVMYDMEENEFQMAADNVEEQSWNIVSLGRFRITYFCTEEYPHICNAGSPYITATGVKPKPYFTISVDPRVIPLGSIVIIDGTQYLAEDTGGAIKGKRIDMCVADHQEAKNLGVYYADVFIKTRKGGNND